MRLWEIKDNYEYYEYIAVREVKTGESRKFDRTGKTQYHKYKQELEQYKEEDIKKVIRKDAKLVSYVEG